MKSDSSKDFKDKEAWLIFRLDTNIASEPVDIYMLMHLPSEYILGHEIVERDITFTHVISLLQQGISKSRKLPEKILIISGEPAEHLIADAAKKLLSSIPIEPTPEPYLDNVLSQIKNSFGKHFFSPSTFGFGDHDAQLSAEEMEELKNSIPDSYDLCSCASGKKYKFCCKKIFIEITNAMVAAEEGKLEEALRWINETRKLVGDTAEVVCRESVVYSFFDIKKSQELLVKCLSINPNHPRAHYLCAIDFVEEGNFEAAILSYEKAIANYPETDHYHLNEAYNNLGIAFYKIGQQGKAKSAWEKALLFMPSDTMTQNNLREFIYQKA